MTNCQNSSTIPILIVSSINSITGALKSEDTHYRRQHRYWFCHSRTTCKTRTTCHFGMPKSSKAQEAQNKLRSLDQGQVDVVSLDLNSLELTQKLPKKLQINMAALMYLLIMPVYFQNKATHGRWV